MPSIGPWPVSPGAVGPYPVIGGGTISANQTLYVAKTGNDTTGTGSASAPFATVSGVLTYLANYWILGSATVTINVGNGTYTDAITVNHPCGSQISIMGANSYAFTFSAVVGDGSSNIKLTVASAANMAVNDYLCITATGSNSDYSPYLLGCWKITGISGTSVTINTAATDFNSNFPNGVVSGSGTVLKTILKSINIATGNVLGGLNLVGFAGISGGALTLQAASCCNIANGGLVGFNVGAIGVSLSTETSVEVAAGGTSYTICCGGQTGTAAIVSLLNSSIRHAKLLISGCNAGFNGIQCNFNSNQASYFTNCSSALTMTGGNFSAASGYITGNSQGITATNGANCQLAGVTFSNNGTDAAPPVNTYGATRAGGDTNQNSFVGN